MDGEREIREEVLKLIASLTLLLDHARKDVEEYESSIEALKRLNRRLAADTRPASDHPQRDRSPKLSLLPGSTHRDTIVTILQGSNEPLTVTQIAKVASGAKLISSARGYRGIYSIITTVLRRNSKHVFVHLKDGLWDLRDRRVFHAGNGNGTGDKSGKGLFGQVLKDFGPQPL
jgi:hypothetical protein